MGDVPTARTAARVLVVEDDRDIAALVALHLRDDGLEVEVAHDGLDGLERALAGEPDLVVLDVMLPGMDGLELTRRLRGAGRWPLLLMLTARGGEEDRVRGLELGADDYLAKPFSLRELQARVRALLRRRAAQRDGGPTPSLLRAGDLEIRVEAREARLRGEPVHLTLREFDLLLHFARHPGRAFTRAELLDEVWGAGYDGFEHTVNSHINRLRAKIERDPSAPELIRTVWGVGYRFEAPEDA